MSKSDAVQANLNEYRIAVIEDHAIWVRGLAVVLVEFDVAAVVHHYSDRGRIVRWTAARVGPVVLELVLVTRAHPRTTWPG